MCHRTASGRVWSAALPVLWLVAGCVGEEQTSARTPPSSSHAKVPRPSPPDTFTAAQSDAVLGSADYWDGTYDRGFGTVAPTLIFNGGDPSGRLEHIRWSHWGASVATGEALTWAYLPEGGGFYDEPVHAQIKAEKLGPCAGRTGYAVLMVRSADEPGGPLGDWYSWSGEDSLCAPMP